MSEIRSIPVDIIDRGRYQPRTHFDQGELEDLAASIRKQGLVQPIVVRPGGQGRYELIAGERRWRAAQLADLQEIDAVVRELDDRAAAEVALIENMQREDLNPMEEAEGLSRLVREFALTHQEAAHAVGKSREVITNALRLLTLTAEAQGLIRSGRLSAGHGKMLAGLEASQQAVLAQHAAHQQWSVRYLEGQIKKLKTGTKQRAADPNIRALELAISETVGNAARIEMTKEGGALRLHFHSLDELDGLLDRLGVSPPQ